MKKNTLTLCLWLACIWVSGQTFQLEVAYADSSQIILPLNISLFDDDSFGFAHFSLTNEVYGAVSRHAANGAVEWCKRIIPDNDTPFEGGRVLATSDGGFLMAGDILEQGLGVIKISQDGTVAWSSLFPGIFVRYVGVVDNIVISETAEGYVLGINSIGNSQDHIIALKISHQGELQAGYKIFIDDFNHIINTKFATQGQYIAVSASVFEGTPNNYTAIGTARLKFDLGSGNIIQSALYASAYPIRDIVIDEAGSEYCLFTEASSDRSLLVKYGVNDMVEWSRWASTHSFDFIAPYLSGLSLSENAVNLHYALGNTPRLGGLNRISQQEGLPLWGKVSRNWHNNIYAQSHAGMTSNDGLIGLNFSGDTGRAILYRTAPDGSLPDCPPINRCDLEMPTAQPPIAGPVDVQIEIYDQQEPLPLTLVEQPLLVTPFCEPLKLPVADFTAESIACPGDSIVVGAIPTEVPASSEWLAPGALVASSNTDSVVFQFPEAGTYQIRHIRTAFDCRDTFLQEVIIEEGPFFELGPDTAFCAGDSLLLESGLPAGEYELNWQDGSNAPTIWVTTVGLYQLAATGNSGCVYEDEIRVSEAATPELDLGADTAFCQGGSYLLAPSTGSSNIDYRWSTNSDSPQLLITEVGTYALTLTDTKSGCTAVDSTKIDSRILPAYAFTPDTAYCPGRVLSLAATSVATNLSFIWPDETEGTQFQVDGIGSYRLIATDGVCADTTIIEVRPDNCSVSVFVPNAFSPNGDGRNDRFEALGPEVEVRRLRIFGRWGGMLFEAEGTDAYWDGRVGGQLAGAGPYVYVLEYLNTLSLEEQQLSGVVYLVR